MPDDLKARLHPPTEAPGIHDGWITPVMKIDRAALSNGSIYKILLFEKFAGSQTGLFGDLVSLYTDSIAGQILFYFFSVHRISVHLLIKKGFTPLHPVA